MVQDGPPPPPVERAAPRPVIGGPLRPDGVARAGRALRTAGLAAAALAALAPLAAVVGYRQGWLSFADAQGVLMRGAAPTLALLALALGVVGLVMAPFGRPRRGFGAALVAIAVGAVVYAGLLQARVRETSAPPIHDVSTDWSDPPMPTAPLAAVRGKDAAPVELAPSLPEGPTGAGVLGRQVADVNRRTCPAAAPAVLLLPPPEAFARAKAAMKARGYALVTDDPAAGVLEGTVWRGVWALADDLMVRIRPAGAGARIDLRSVSRAGLGDGGANCAHVTRLRAALGG